mmetsp:Transcript_19288/g.24885  ORF Transcript_19288/g.24885 Transcript_19288/m.24885 type:complete len:138 (+) Transcript_19288:294-707(+)|eukprot:CAMPEP_0198147412 /NCGR_PEP_ID=MMETSP1443-20131203/35523_1 /TAXON_ID=186043 /ORGANISM="Entomoneis sp., Strain CCMP2396" /LENGTH=137 /DNA_ID=CAMNT_0043811741 /DNA_START=224 /DNA_END=637 /DNA_ORIENTATION=-
MFGKSGEKSDYNKISLDDFSDDDSSQEENSPSAARSRTPAAGRSQILMKQQDEGLEMLGQSAERLGKMSLVINEELGFQNKMLDEMEDGLDEAGDNLDLVTRKTQEFIEFTGGQQNCIMIMTLAVIAVILLFLILYT